MYEYTTDKVYGIYKLVCLDCRLTMSGADSIRGYAIKHTRESGHTTVVDRITRETFHPLATTV